MINVFISLAIKGGSMFIALFTTPAYIRYFSNDAVLGVWFTLLSILAWLLNFDLGIGNGLRNKMTEALARKDHAECRRYVSSAYIMLVLLSVCVLAIGSCVLAFLPWNRLLGVSTEVLAQDALLRAVRTVFFSIILQFVLRLITSICFALQHSFVPNMLNLCTNVALLIYASIANHIGCNGSINTLAWVYLLAVNIPLLLTTLFLFASRLKTLRPNPRYFSWQHARATLQLGCAFLLLQLLAMLLNNTANFLISLLLGAEQVVEYQIYHKLFFLPCTLISIAIVPMWSAITKSYVQGHNRWLKRAVLFMFCLVILSVVVEFVIVPMLPFLFKIWLGKDARPVNYTVAIVFAAFGSLFTWQQICCCISNGLGKLKLQAICLVAGVIISFSTAFILAKLWNHYIAVTVGTALGYIPLCVCQTIWTMRFCKQLPQDPPEN